jgi:hypothetical protein
MATERAVFKIRHFPFLILNFPFAPKGRGRFGGIENAVAYIAFLPETLYNRTL